MRIQMWIMAAVLGLALPVLARAQEGAAGGEDKGLMMELDKEDLGDKAGQIMFVPGKAGEASGEKKADEGDYKSYKHKHIEEYDKIAVKKEIMEEQWSDKCGKYEKCMNRLRKTDKEADKIKKLARKLAFLDSVRKELKKELAAAKEAQKRKLQGAKKLIDKDLKKAVGEAKKSNEEFDMKIFNLEKVGEKEGE